MIRAVGDADREAVRAFIRERWGGETVVAHGVVYHPHRLPGFVALEGGEWAGLMTYRVERPICEIVTFDAVTPGCGVGTMLLDVIRAECLRWGCRRLCLTTTNDNLDAMRFYQRRGFCLVAVRPSAVDESRRLKPSIPAVGLYGIPIRDELDFEMAVTRD